MNELDVGKKYYVLGKNLSVVDTEFGKKVGLKI